MSEETLVPVHFVHFFFPKHLEPYRKELEVGRIVDSC